MKVSRQRAHPRRRSELPEPDIRTPHFPPLAIPGKPGCRKAFSPLAFTEAGASIGFVSRVNPRPSGLVMRYRSATVAGSHGLPCVSGTDAKNQRGDMNVALGSRQARFMCIIYPSSSFPPAFAMTYFPVLPLSYHHILM
jgi:hypothetical protein